MRNANDGKAVENALVEVTTGSSAGRGVRTDATGAYRLEGLSKGSTRLQVTATGFSSDGATLDLTADATFTFQLRPAS